MPGKRLRGESSSRQVRAAEISIAEPVEVPMAEPVETPMAEPVEAPMAELVEAPLAELVEAFDSRISTVSGNDID